MRRAQPKADPVIVGLTITENDDVITIVGTVPDEPTHQSLLKAAKETPGVKEVKDQMKVSPKKN